MIMRVKARMDAEEDVPDCLIKTLLLTQEQEKLDWKDLCFMANAFNLGGVHSVSISCIILPGDLLIQELLFIRLLVLSCGFWLSSLHALKFKPEPMPNWIAWLAEMVRQVQKTSSAFRTSELSLKRYSKKLGPFNPSQLKSVSLGRARPSAVLDTAAALFDRRLCIQWDVHPEEHSGHSKLLWNTPQRGEVSGSVRNHLQSPLYLVQL